MFRSTLAIALLAGAAHAIEPPRSSDEVLAHASIIVQARWNGKAIVNHGGMWGLRAEIIVERVIRGNVRPGTHTVRLAWPVAWEPEGGPVCGYSSTEVVGDIEEVKESNLWFLSGQPNRDKKDPGWFLYLGGYRGVQPLELAPWFNALAQKDPGAAIKRLLNKGVDRRTAHSALAYLCGGDELPWPKESWRALAEDRPERKPKPEFRKGYQKEVATLLEHKDASVRRFAVSVLGAMAGPTAAPRIRKMLRDQDGNVRGVAVGVLAKMKDAPSLQALSESVKGIDDDYLACRVIERLGDWGHPDAVEAVISFLQNDASGRHFFGGPVPALKAQAALEKMTGHHFPCDVRRATKAWAKARSLPNKKERREFLANNIPAPRTPFSVLCHRQPNGKSVILELKNDSNRNQLVARRPQMASTGVELEGGGSSWSGRSFAEIEGATEFVTVKPGQVLKIPADVGETFGSAKKGKRTMTIHFVRNGHEWGLNAWIGQITVKVSW